VADTGFHRLLVPREFGGVWESTARSTRPMAEAIARISGADSSLGLVLSMQPFALFLTGWLADFDPALVDHGWLAQRAGAFERLRDEGGAWGIMMSERTGASPCSATPCSATPCSATPCSATPCSATPWAGDGYRMTGEKSWGSGWGAVAFMLTTAVPEGEETPDYFILDTARAFAEGTAKASRAWDGHGMAASNSDAVRLDGARVTRVAWRNRLDLLKGMRANPTVAARLAPTVGILRAAVAAGAEQLRCAPPARHYEAVEWARARAGGWLAEQALEGVIRISEVPRSAEEFDATGRMAKLAIAGLAETTLLQLTHALGARTYSGSSPFGWWLDDVRALGYLMPTVSQAVERLTS
jgi:alkylation response protein AidB-like acyl-CoA dehydrogenase